MDILPPLYHGDRALRSSGPPRGGLGAIVVALIALASLAAACGGGEPAPAQIVTAGGATPEATPLVAALGRLPDAPGARQQILFGDLVRLRNAYGEDGVGDALAGVWLPDALAGAGEPSWRKEFGFGIRAVDRFAATGFHPDETAVLTGRFRAPRVRETLRANGWRRRGALFTRGADGSVNDGTAAGRLALSSLNRVAVARARLVAASTTALGRATLSPEATLGEDPDIGTLAEALGRVTGAAIVPAGLVRPPTGVVVAPLATAPALLVGAAVDDRGPDERVLRIALLYAEPAQAQSDAAAIASAFPAADVPTREGKRFGDLLTGIETRVVSDRVVLVEGTIAEGELTGIWRGLLESGDLAVLVRQG
jgi:hypothetical protein